ncbi:hypothetical protein TCAL_11761 [Tigriopus californicus]|uniref:Laminin G domain-containing protein n=1 Tax=Tigriopus californicus TaxID=6832 RepID=A0A553NNH0_TIGCA|nr:hypothetical protein TCAL_11761 [Tigriopus californicus]
MIQHAWNVDPIFGEGAGAEGLVKTLIEKGFRDCLGSRCIQWINQYPFSVPASFYGSSHVSLPLQDAKSTTDISFRFRTSKAEALLVLVAGRIDYCLVMLQGGAIKVHINLGAGESELSSPRGLRLDDLKWHQVKIIRNDADMSLVVDDVHSTKVNLPGRFYELNVHFGVFVGGMGDFSEIFLGNQENFRGCLEEVYFNGVQVLEEAKLKAIPNGPNPAIVKNLTWDCSREFDATNEQAISFVQPKAFISFPNWISRSGAMVSFKVKTHSTNAVLFYNTGPSANKDFVALEIWNGLPRLLLDQVTVDGETRTLRPSKGENKHIDLSGLLYFGGIESSKRSRAVEQGVIASKRHLQGCLQDLQLDGRRIGLNDVLETSGIQADCVWEFPCLQDRKLCLGIGSCSQKGTQDYECSCQDGKCNSGSRTSPEPKNLELVALKALEVEEGGRALLTSHHLHVVTDFAKYGVKESGVLFHMVETPTHGKLDVSVWNKVDDNIFTLLDLNTDKVHYVNDGSEFITDQIVFEMEFSSSGSLPAHLQKRQRFLFQIVIVPKNDIPQVKLAYLDPLRLAQSTEKLLSGDLFEVRDTDSPAAEIVFSVVNRNEKESGGFLRNDRYPSQRIDDFTLQDLREGNIYYVDEGDNSDSQLGLRVSDGRHEGNVVTLRIQTFKLQVFAVNNTGLSLPTGTSALITSYNLTFTTNAPEQSLNIRFDVLQSPRYGRIERLRGNGRWVSTKRFFSRQLEKEKVRYVHTKGNPSKDSFRFTAVVLDLSNGGGSKDGSDAIIHGPTNDQDAKLDQHIFHINFITLQVQALRNLPLKLINVRETVITDSHLMYQTFPQRSEDSEVYYTIQSAPKHGALLLTQAGTDGLTQQERELRADSSFSQVDLLAGFLKYRLFRHVAQKALDDNFSFVVQTVEQKSAIQMFHLHYVPGDADVEITLERLEVDEGGKKAITPKYLNIKVSDIHHFVYNVTKPPQHGQIDILAANKVEVMRRNTSFFTSEEIQDERVVKDLKFIDLDIDTKPEDIHYNHPPIPIGELVLVENPSQPIYKFTQRDLNEERILFKHLGANFGRLMLWVSDGQYYVSTELKVRASPPFIKVANNSGLIVQRGESAFLTLFNLSVETNLNNQEKDIVYHIQTGPTYGEMLRDDVPIRDFTELDLLEQRIEYRNNRNGVDTDSSKTLKDVLQFTVEAINYGNSAAVESGAGPSAHGTLTFHVFPESYWEPLEIASNNSLLVEESTSIAITQRDLQILPAVTSNDISSKDIIYMVKVPPRFGYLEIDPPITSEESKFLQIQRDLDSQKGSLAFSPSSSSSSSSSSIRGPQLFAGADLPNSGFPPSSPFEVNVFDQSIINEGRLHYIQSISNQSSDSFVFDVTNGISQLTDLHFHFTILPKTLYIETREMTVTEGKSTLLMPSHMHVITSYYEDKIEDYLIVDPPTSGRIVSTEKSKRRKNRNEESLTIFSIQDLKDQTVEYVHNGNDTLVDEFTLVGRTDSKTSVPAVVHIRIIPVNDETPVLVNNTGLEIFAGATVPISSSNLGATDADTDDVNVVFMASGPECGRISLQSIPGRPLTRFTQADLKMNRLLFTHTGGRNGMMKVTLSDGLNTAKAEYFRIRVKDVSLRLSQNEALDVFPMMQTALTSDHLLVVSSDFNPKREITFIVKREPQHGRVLFKDPRSNDMVPVRNFTQAHINGSLVFYEHNRPFSNLTIFDGLNLEALSEFAVQRLDIVFHIRVSVSAMIPGGIDRFIGSDIVTLEEGQNVAILTRDLNTTGVLQYLYSHQARQGAASPRPPVIRLQVSKLPDHGFIAINGLKARTGQMFSQADVDRGFMSYHHDHSDTTQDSFGIAIYLEGDRSEVYGDGKGTKGDVLLYNGKWNVSILPVNDQAFRLLTDSPSMTIVQSQARAITRDMLLTEDGDNSPAEIVYDVINFPSNGRLHFKENRTSDVARFTQADIDMERLMYFHDGTLKPVDFYFRVSDGMYKPIYRHFRIHILPLEVRLVNRTAIQIQQGTRMAYISSHNMGVMTNGQRVNTFFEVTKNPKGGQLYMNDKPSAAFTQMNIDHEEVLFMQTDMTLSNDSFECYIFNQGASLSNQVFQVSVAPLVRQSRPFIAQHKEKTVLLQEHLDATQLSGLTNSNPVYFLLEAPRFGRIMRIVRSSGSTRQSKNTRSKRSLRDREIWQFTHEDVKNGIIHFVPDLGALESLQGHGANDSFVYRLVAPNVQPANGVFGFAIEREPIVPPEETYTNSYPRGIKEKGGSELNHVNPMAGTLILVMILVVTILLIIILVVFLIKCRRDQKQKRCGRESTASSADIKYNSDSLSTHHTHFGTSQRRTPISKSNGHTHAYEPDRQSTTDYENGILPMPTDDALSSHQRSNNDPRFAHIHSNGTLPRPTMNGNHSHNNSLALPNPASLQLTTLNPSDSDSWMESSRSRETSPASSIPPGMPPFRVIPLCDSESNGTHFSDPSAYTTLGTNGNPPFPRTSSNLGSDLGSDRPYGPMYPRSGSDAESNAPSEAWTGPNGATMNGNGLNGNGGPQTLLRRNQYWV